MLKSTTISFRGRKWLRLAVIAAVGAVMMATAGCQEEQGPAPVVEKAPSGVPVPPGSGGATYESHVKENPTNPAVKKAGTPTSVPTSVPSSVPSSVPK